MRPAGGAYSPRNPSVPAAPVRHARRRWGVIGQVSSWGQRRGRRLGEARSGGLLRGARPGGRRPRRGPSAPPPHAGVVQHFPLHGLLGDMYAPQVSHSRHSAEVQEASELSLGAESPRAEVSAMFCRLTGLPVKYIGVAHARVKVSLSSTHLHLKCGVMYIFYEATIRTLTHLKCIRLFPAIKARLY